MLHDARIACGEEKRPTPFARSLDHRDEREGSRDVTTHPVDIVNEREVAVEGLRVQDIAAIRRHCLRIRAWAADRTFVRLEQACRTEQQRGFSGATLAGNANDLACGNLQVDVDERANGRRTTP